MCPSLTPRTCRATGTPARRELTGTGKLNYPRYLQLLHQSGYDGALILHSLGEDQVEGCVDFLKRSSTEAGVPLS